MNLRILIVLTLFAGLVKSDAQPVITRQPVNQSVSLGACVKFEVSATSTNPPILFQWRFATTNLSGATKSSLTLTNILITNAGDYDAVLTDGSGTATSQGAHLEVDATFTKINTGPIVTDLGYSGGGTWGDYNNDGSLDLFIFNGSLDGPTYAPFLYRNNGDGTFAKVTNGPPVNDPAESASACWGDYDNDGNLDLFAATTGRNLLYHNNGDGAFTRITTAGNILLDSARTLGAAWVDYDNDGLLDLFVTTADSSANAHNFLYRNNGGGTFSSITNSILVTDRGSSLGCVWGDYDNDGHLDLFVCGGRGLGNGLAPNRLYHNKGDGTFTKVSTGSLATDVGYSGPCAWGDYDNDGSLDLFVANVGGLKNFLYHNNGDGTFTRTTNGIVVTNVADAFGCAWGDYDNDGFLDLFVSNRNINGSNPAVVNFLDHNNGDGTFTKITAGSPVNEDSDSWGCSWSDYDNDGFLDLFVARGGGRSNYLYRNNGNNNSWLTVKLIGTVSNRSAIGAKVRVKAIIGGVSRWQLRQISGGSGWVGYNELRANFGLGDATNIDLVRIEWPSGTVQEFHDVVVKRFLTVAEPPRLNAGATLPDGSFQLSLIGGVGLSYEVQTSSDLAGWSFLAALTNTNRTMSVIDTATTNGTQRFYRAVSR